VGRGFLIVVCSAFLGGCALPLPVQIASWALDGISLITTEKSLTDHGISMVAKKDCALWRGVAGREICINGTDDAGTVLLAAVEPPHMPEPVLVTSITAARTEAKMPKTATSTWTPEAAVAAEELTDFETAAGAAVAAVDVAEPRVEEQSMPVAEPVEMVSALDAGNDGERLLIPGRRVWSSDRAADLYYVIGSFSERDNARKFVSGHSELGPAVMASRLDGKEVYRVAVGPFVGDQKVKVGRKIKKSGLKGAWAIRIDHTDWMVAARPSPKPSEPLAETLPAKAVPPLVSSDDETPEAVKPVDDQLASAGTGSPAAAPVRYGSLYYVIGSFDVVDNARSFATETLIGGQASQVSQVSFEPTVVSDNSGDKWRHRVIVGPFAEQDRERVRSDLNRAGIGEPWSIRLPKTPAPNTPMAYRFNATGASAPQIADTGPDLAGSG